MRPQFPTAAALLGFAALPLLSARASAQLPTEPTTWRGLSHCVDARHPCTDEQVIYRLPAAPPDSSRWMMQGYKIVGADTIDMGPLSLTRGTSGSLVATLPMGVWTFVIHHDSLTGSLALSDGSVMRRVQAHRMSRG